MYLGDKEVRLTSRYFWFKERILDVVWTLVFFGVTVCLTLCWIGFLLLMADDNMGPLQIFDGLRAVPLTLCTVCSWFLAFSVWSYATPLLRRRMLHTILLAEVAVFQTVSSNFASYLHSFHVSQPRLYDVGFSLLPEFAPDSIFRKVSELLVAFSVVLFLATAFCLDERRRARAWVDWARLTSVMYAFRGLTVWWTIMPGPAPHCDPTSPVYTYKKAPTLLHILTHLGPIYGNFDTCGDLLFSGHTALVTTNLLLFRKHLPISSAAKHSCLTRLSMSAYLLVCGVFIIASRKHYTVDVVLGVMIAALVFSRFEHGWKRRTAVFPSKGATAHTSSFRIPSLSSSSSFSSSSSDSCSSPSSSSTPPTYLDLSSHCPESFLTSSDLPAEQPPNQQQQQHHLNPIHSSATAPHLLARPSPTSQNYSMPQQNSNSLSSSYTYKGIVGLSRKWKRLSDSVWHHLDTFDTDHDAIEPFEFYNISRSSMGLSPPVRPTRPRKAVVIPPLEQDPTGPLEPVRSQTAPGATTHAAGQAWGAEAGVRGAGHLRDIVISCQTCGAYNHVD